RWFFTRLGLLPNFGLAIRLLVRSYCCGTLASCNPAHANFLSRFHGTATTDVVTFSDTPCLSCPHSEYCAGVATVKTWVVATVIMFQGNPCKLSAFPHCLF
ncbi:hypothetical protein GBAR_LOCUS5094, partial [Geodia barretti]